MENVDPILNQPRVSRGVPAARLLMRGQLSRCERRPENAPRPESPRDLFVAVLRGPQQKRKQWWVGVLQGIPTKPPPQHQKKQWGFAGAKAIDPPTAAAYV